MLERGSEIIRYTWNDGKGGTEDITAKVFELCRTVLHAHSVDCPHDNIDCDPDRCCCCDSCRIAKELLGIAWKIVVKQAGGKYGTFLCPVCREYAGNYKFSTASGWCDKCGRQFILTNGQKVDSGEITVIEIEEG